MENFSEDLWFEILDKISSEKDLVPCMSVSRLWHRIASDLWVKKFWAQSSPPLGLFYCTVPRSTTLGNLQYYHHMNYISLYNYYTSAFEDNLERTRLFRLQQFCKDLVSYRTEKRDWQLFDRGLYDANHDDDDTDDEDDLDSQYHTSVNEKETQQLKERNRDRDQYLNSCNGLLLLLKSATHQFYVCNPITRQQVAIPKACVHKNQDYQHFCAALAFDPSESPHRYQVVRIDYSLELASTALLDIFSSEYGRWIRHRLQLDDSSLIEGFKSCKPCRQLFYLQGKLYGLTMSWKLLCIDLKTIEACTLELPVPETDRSGAMGCLGVSKDILCYMKRVHDKSSSAPLPNMVVWSFENSEWIPRYSVRCRLLGAEIRNELGYECDDTMEPYAISPSSNLLFFGTPTLICCINLKSEKLKFVCTTSSKLDTPACFLTLRACFVPFLLNREVGAMSSKGIDILSVEAPNSKQEDSESVKVIDVKLYDSWREDSSPLLVYPSEIMGMHLELEQMEMGGFTWSDSSDDDDDDDDDDDNDDDDDEHEHKNVVDEFEGLVGSMWKKRKINR